jgi:C4-dicarboxylate transporter
MIEIKYNDPDIANRYFFKWYNILITMLFILMFVSAIGWIFYTKLSLALVLLASTLITVFVLIFIFFKNRKTYENLTIIWNDDKSFCLKRPNSVTVINAENVIFCRMMEGRVFVMYKDAGLFKKTLNVFPSEDAELSKIESHLKRF